jgi:hypothetical protein
MWRPLPLALLVFAAGCSKSLGTTETRSSSNPLDATMRCVAAAADSLGYKPRMTSHGKSLEAIHKDSVLAPYEDGRYEKITVNGANSKSSPGMSSFTITASTFSQHWTKIGLEDDEIIASEKVTEDAKTIAARCGGART